MKQSGAASPSKLTVGSITLAHPVILAPMSGITDAPFRRQAMRLGAPLVVSEMAACAGLAAGRRDIRLRLEQQGIGAHVIQLAGCEAKWMAEGARIAEASGADLIDINMGCPAKHVTNGASGSALMRNLDHALKLIEATVGAVTVPVTLKMRLGWDDRSRNAAELARRAQAAGVKLITVHGRTRQQFFSGCADWNAVHEVKQTATIPVVVNGDIRTFNDAKQALEESGADAVMIGRGAQGRPWFPSHVGSYLATGLWPEAPSVSQQYALLCELYDDILTHYGLRIGLRHARKHLGWSLDVAAETANLTREDIRAWRTSVLTAEETGAVQRSLADAFSALADRAAA